MNKNISRETLVRHNIYYEASVYRANHANLQPPTHVLPDHVKAVRDGLLFMEKLLPEDCDATLQEELAKYGSVNVGPYWCLHPEDSAFTRGKHHERTLQQSPSHDNLRFCEEIAERAKEKQDDSEEELTFFWRSKIFGLFNDEARTHPGFIPALDAWSLYGNVLWNEFDKFVKPLPPGAPCRTQPKPNLTYAFPIQTSAPESLEDSQETSLLKHSSFSRSENSWSVVAKWSSYDRSCFPWAVVEMKKDVSTSDNGAVERCYCQAANAAAAALDLQAQLFDKTHDDYSLRPPPVVEFTCVGPVVKVWLAYQDKSRGFGPNIQRMVCIWSTSILLTWGVASLRAIIRNMHTWSSRLLKPRLQVAISQASRALSNPFDFLRPSSRFLPIPTVHFQVLVPMNSSSTLPSTSSRVAPIIAQNFGKPITPERHNTPASSTRIDTPTPSRSTENKSPPCNNYAKEISNSRNDLIFGTWYNNFGDRSTMRTTGQFERATGSRTGICSTSGFGSSTNTTTHFGSSTSTTTGFGLRSQRAINNGGLFSGGISIGIARGPGQYTSGSNASNGLTRSGLFGSSNSATHCSDIHQNSKKSSTSGLPSKLATTSGSENSISNSSACGSSPKPAFGPSWKQRFGTHDSIKTSSTIGPSPEPASVSSFNSEIGSPYKPSSGGFGTSSNSDRGGLFGSANWLDLTARSGIGASTSLASFEKTDVGDITTAFASTSLKNICRDHTTPGTAGTLFSGYRQPKEGWGQDDFRTITCQAPYENDPDDDSDDDADDGPISNSDGDFGEDFGDDSDSSSSNDSDSNNNFRDDYSSDS